MESPVLKRKEVTAYEWTSPMHSRLPRWTMYPAIAMAMIVAVFSPIASTAAGAEFSIAAEDLFITGEEITEGVDAPSPKDVPDELVPEEASDQVTEVDIKRDGDGKLGRKTVEPFRMVGVTWEHDPEVSGVRVQVQVRIAGEWSEWETLPQSELEIGRPGTDPMWIDSLADGVAVKVESQTGVPADVQVSTINPDANPSSDGVSNQSDTLPHATSRSAVAVVGEDEDQISNTAASVVAKPKIITRAQWGAGPGTTCSAPRSQPKALGVVLHHTAGSNTANRSESESIIRGYQTYHVRGRGWCDIGYNFLVDRWGQIFEGRKGGITKQIRGAHAGVDIVNQWATGVSMMGNFDVAEPPTAMKDAVVHLIAWRMQLFGTNPNGTYRAGGKTYKTINGHRDVKSTACPGKYGYAWLNASNGLRKRVTTMLAEGAPDEESETPAMPTGIAVTSMAPTAATISWPAVPNAAKYRVVWRPDPQATATVVFVTQPQIRLTGLTPSSNYVIAVSAVGDDGSTSTRSPLLPFTTAAVTLAAPTGVRASSISSSAMTWSWNASAGASKYRVVWRAKSSTKGKLVYTKSPSYRLTGLKPNTEYVLAVSAIDSAGKFGKRTALYTAKTNAAGVLPRPTGVKASAVSTTAMTWSWNATRSASKYRVVWRAKSSTKGKLVYTKSPSYRLTGLKPNTEYVFAVSAVSASGKVGTRTVLYSAKTRASGSTSGSSSTTTTTTIAKPTGLAIGSTSSNSATIKWNAVSGAVKYRVVWRPSSAANAKLVYVTSPNITLTGLKASTDHVIGVSAVSASGVTSARAGLLNFRTSAATTNTMKNSVTVPSSRKVVIKGHGFGHGIGMSQHGAQGAAKQGVKYDKILSHYYPGTKLGSKSGNIRVQLTKVTNSEVKVVAASGIKFRNLTTDKLSTLPTTRNGGKVTHWNIVPRSGNKKQSTLRYKVGSTWRDYTNFTGAAQFEGPATLEIYFPDGKKHKYRGALRSVPRSSGATNRWAVNVLNIEHYTKGVVAREMPSGWQTEALKAQSVAARTYGVRAIKSSGTYDICDTTSCQVYGGVAAEATSTNAAVDGTKGKILTYSGSPAFTQFSSSSGGWTNKGSQSYLKPVQDDWDNFSGNSVHNWTLTVKASTIEKAYPTIGTLKSISITKRNGYGDSGGRVTSVTLKGSKASKAITGVDARWAFGMRSDWFGF